MPEPGDESTAGGRGGGSGADIDKAVDLRQAETASGRKPLANALGGAFVLSPAGTFQMGAPDSEPGHRTNEGPVHEIVLGKPFYLGLHPVTQAQYLAVTGKNPSRFTTANGGGSEHPVEL